MTLSIPLCFIEGPECLWINVWGKKQCTSYHHYILLPLCHTAITSYRHYIILPLHHTSITSYLHYIIAPLHHTAITSYRHYTIHYTWPLLVVLPWESTQWRLLADSASVTVVSCNNQPNWSSQMCNLNIQHEHYKNDKTRVFHIYSELHVLRQNVLDQDTRNEHAQIS